jgi:hypothetical protein
LIITYIIDPVWSFRTAGVWILRFRDSIRHLFNTFNNIVDIGEVTLHFAIVILVDGFAT